MMKIFFDNAMVYAKPLPSPSPRKPWHLLQRWLWEFPEEIETVCSVPATRLELATVHDVKYVEGVCAGTVANGFGEKSVPYAQSALAVVGSFVAATHFAIEHQTVTCSPTSGFHHAGWDQGGGFCTFNGLMVAAVQALERLPKHQKVLILDCDYHYGDGTADILEHFDYAERIVHLTAGEFFCQPSQAKDFLAWLDLQLELHLPGAGVLLYQAGADPHIDDPLGGFLTDAELLARDQAVFSHAQSYQVPVVWNLAGGYQTPLERVLRIHSNTLSVALKFQSARVKAGKARHARDQPQDPHIGTHLSA